MAGTDIDKDLMKSLQQARKKPRNFAIVAKGSTVLKLIVSKKPIKDGELLKAKKEVGGNAIVKGVVTSGDGPELLFQVAEEVSLQEPKFKTFIKEQTGLPLKPRFVVVSSLQEVDDEDVEEELQGELPEEQEGQEQEHEQQPTPTEKQTEPEQVTAAVDKGPSAEQLVAALNKLAPAIKQAVAAHPNRKDEILKPVAAFQKYVKANELSPAKEALLQVGAVLKSLKVESTQAPVEPAPVEPKPEDPAQKVWENRWPEVESAYLGVLPGQPSEADKLRAIAGYAQEQAAAGQYAKGVAALDRLQPMVRAAEAELVERKKQLAEALESLRRAQVLVGKVKTAVTADLGSIPPALATKFAEVDKSLALDKSTDPAKINQAAEDSGDALAAIDKDTQRLVAEKQAYASDLGLIEGRLKALQSHAQGTVDFVKGKIDAIQLEVEAAKKLAGEHRYVEAAKKLLDVAGLSADAEALADQHAQYTGLLADRQLRVDALTDSTQPDAQKLVTAVREKLAKAKEHATAPKQEFAKAVVLLNQVPKDCIDAAWMVKKAGEYDAALTGQTNAITTAKTWSPDVHEVGPYLPEVELLLENGKYDKTKDYVKSVSLIQRVGSKLGELWKIIKAFREFREEYNKAKTKISDLEKHKGAAGIAPQIARLKSDRAFAETKRDAHEYVTAKNVCLNIVKLGDEAKQIADKHKAYLDRRKEVTDKRATFTGGKSGWVSDLLGEADKLVASAATKVTAQDYPEAKKELDAAFARCEKAQVVLDNQKRVDQWKSDAEPLIGNVAADFEAAFNKFASIKAAVVNYDSDAAYTGALDAAEGKANQARAEATKPSPDVAQAQGLLREAIQDCNNVVFWVDQLKSCQQLREPIVNRVGTLKGVAREDVLRDEIQAIEDKLTEAKGEADSRKFAAAEARVTEAQKLLVDADKKAKLYDDYTALRDPAVNNAIAAVDTVEGRAAMDVEVAKLKTDLTAANTQRTNKELQKALDALKKIKATADGLKTKLDDYKKAKTREKAWILDKLDAIKGKPAVADEYQRVQDLQVELKTMFDERQFLQAYNMTHTIGVEIYLATQVLDRYQQHVVQRDRAQEAINQLKAVACDAIKDDIKTAENFFSKAETFAAQRNYENAAPQLAKVLEFCVQPTAVGKASKLYEPALAAAQEAVAALTKDFAGAEAVALEVKQLQAVLASAQGLAKKKSFEDAKKLADEVTAAAAEVRKAAQTHGEFDDTAKAAAAGPKDKLDGLEAEIEKIRKLAGQLATRGSVAIQGELTSIAQLLATADKERQANRAAQARDALTAAAQKCAAANVVADQYAQVDKALLAATAKVAAVRKKYADPALVQLTANDLDKQLGFARADADNELFTSALNSIQSVQTEVAQLESLGAQHASYLAERKQLDPRLEKLAKSKARYVIAKELGEARAYVAEADTKVEARDYREALKLLAGAADIADRISLQADMHEEQEPTPEALQAILKKPNGEKQLDAIIKTLDPKAKRKVCKLALELRFDTKLQLFSDKDGNTLDADQEKNAPDIVRFYDVMQALPKSHTRENPSMALVKRLGEDVGTSSFNSGTRELKLRIGRATDKTERMIAQEWEMGEVDDDAKPSDADPPTKFSWTTLHEIGHAVDDKLAFMQKNANGAAYGGWKEYGANVSEIAEVAAKHFHYDQAYLASYLSGEKPLQPEPPNGTTAEDWDRQRIEAETWCDAIRNDKNIYYSDSATKRLQIGGRVYQEAYANQWVSYDFAARKKGVAGYQFRAPGEWFAEIYAAFHTGKLNKKHPAREWLSRL